MSVIAMITALITPANITHKITGSSYFAAFKLQYLEWMIHQLHLEVLTLAFQSMSLHYCISTDDTTVNSPGVFNPIEYATVAAASNVLNMLINSSN
jgi:hypothetical protein